MQTFSNIQDILKEVYTEVLVNQMPVKSPWWAVIKKKLVDMDGGKRIVIPVQLGFTEAVGARYDGNNTLPTSQKNTYDQAYIYMKRLYGRIKIEGLAMEASKGKNAWVDALTAETKGIINAFAIDIDRQLMEDGKGIMGKVASVSGQVITLTARRSGDVAAKWFRKGQVLDIYDGNGNKHADSVSVTAVDTTNGTITVSGTITSVVANDLIYKEDSYTASTNTGELMGIDGIVDTGNTPGSDFQGIDASAEPLWQAYIASNVGVLSETKIQDALDAIDVRTDGNKVDLAVTTPALRTKLISLMQALRKVETLDFTAGWKAIRYVGGEVELPFLVHPKAPVGYIYLVALPHLKLYVLKNLTWDTTNGGMIKNSEGADEYYAWFKMYANFGTDCRNAHGKMTGVTTS